MNESNILGTDGNSEGDWVVFAGLGGGFGGANEMGIWSGEKMDAESESYRLACEEYEGFEGMHGIRDVSEIMEEDEVDESEAQEIYNEDKENWVEYYVESYDSDKHESDIDNDMEKLN